MTVPHSGVESLAAELHRLPVAGVTIGTGRCLPGAVGCEYFVYQSAFAVGDALPHRCPCRSRSAVDATPALTKPEHQLVVALVEVGGDVVFHPQRPFVELRHGGLHHLVAHFLPVDVYLMVTQRGDDKAVRTGTIGRRCQVTGIHIERRAQHRRLGPCVAHTTADELLGLGR